MTDRAIKLLVRPENYDILMEMNHNEQLLQRVNSDVSDAFSSPAPTSDRRSTARSRGGTGRGGGTTPLARATRSPQSTARV